MEDQDVTFEAYFSGNIGSAQANDFSTALSNDPELNEKYNFYLAAKRSASLIERDRMRKELEGIDFEEEVETGRSNSKSPVLRLLKWGGSIAAIFLIAIFAYNTLQPPTSQALFAQNFEPYKVQAARGGEMDALKANYTQGKYDLFIEEINELEGSPEIYMMLANAHINLDQHNEAIKILSKISDNTSLRDQKYWYLGLCQLVLGNIEEAKSNLNKLSSLSNFKKTEVEEILSTISKE